MASPPDSIGGYKVVKELGRGAMGVVYLAVHPTLDREMAIKVMARELSSDPEFVERFRREGAMASKLRHPNIVQVFDFAQSDGLYFIAMEYLGERTLKDLLKQSSQQPVDKACEILDQLLSALAHAHAKGIVHRDIKPANVMLTDEGSIALTDFSVAHMKESSKLTQTGAVLGTPEYMAPEQFEGSWDQRSDLYSAGILFYELLTGFSPFRATTITEVMRKQLLTVPDPPAAVDFTLPEAISRVVARTLEKDPDARYQTAEEMRKAIRVALDNPLAVTNVIAPPSPLPESLSEPPTGPVLVASSSVPSAADYQDRGRRRNSLARLILLGLVLLAGWGMARQPDRPSDRIPPPTSSPSALALASLSPEPTPIVSESPQAIASLTPQDTATPSLSPTPVPFLTASASASPQQAVATPGMLPDFAEINPGIGVGAVDIGDSMEQVRQAWGKPWDQGDVLQGTFWSYTTGETASCNLLFDTDTKQVRSLSVYNRRFLVDGESGIGVGTSYEKILETFGEPTTRTDIMLDYNPLGIYFMFGSERDTEEEIAARDGTCQAVVVYERYHSDQVPETPSP